jgi:DNA-directed RNA polymerase specialized sigma54-like protein
MEDEIRKLIEEIDPEGKIAQSTIEELVIAIQEIKKNPPKDGEVRDGLTYGVLEEEIKKQIRDEPDWRVKAALAAKLISNNLE